jgi:hypothetical protein
MSEGEFILGNSFIMNSRNFHASISYVLHAAHSEKNAAKGVCFKASAKPIKSVRTNSLRRSSAFGCFIASKVT